MSYKSWRAERDFNFRLRTLEVNSCDEHLVAFKKQDRAEISQWGESSRWVIAYYVPTSEGGFDLKWVGKRPLDTDWAEFREIAEIGFRLLEARGEGAG